MTSTPAEWIGMRLWESPRAVEAPGLGVCEVCGAEVEAGVVWCRRCLERERQDG